MCIRCIYLKPREIYPYRYRKSAVFFCIVGKLGVAVKSSGSRDRHHRNQFVGWGLAVLFFWLFAVVLVISLVACPHLAHALESDYAAPWCAERGGVAEKVLADRTRVDCLLPGFAVEVDYAHKWAEAMGQALHYARMTGRMPGVLLILHRPADERYVHRLYGDAEYWSIPLFVWTVKAYEKDVKQQE